VKGSLPRNIFAGLLIGTALGTLSKFVPVLNSGLIAIEPIGTAFIRLVTMIVVPLVIASLFTAVGSLGDIRRLGAIGGRTLSYFLITTFLAAAIGFVVGMVAPFRPLPTPPAAGAAPTPSALPSVPQQLLALIPQNPFAAAAQGELLPLIVAVCLFAAATTTLPDEKRRQILIAFERLNDLSTILIGWMMRLAPYAVFVLIAATVAKFGAALLGNLLTFAAAVVAALIAHVAIVLVPAARLAGVRIREFLRETSDAVMLAFATASSSAALPVSMAAAKRVGVSEEAAGFVLPAGATIDKNGAAAYKAVTAVFIATLFGFPLTPARQLTIVLASTAAAFAGAGVPGSSLVTNFYLPGALETLKTDAAGRHFGRRLRRARKDGRGA